VVAPIAVPRECARLVGLYLDDLTLAFADRAAGLGDSVQLFHSLLSGLALKLRKAARRKGSGESVRLSTVTWYEAWAGFQFLAARTGVPHIAAEPFLDPRGEEYANGAAIRTACAELWPSLLLSLRARGRRKMSLRTAEEWVSRYKSLPSSERWEIGGTQFAKARGRIASIDTIMSGLGCNAEVRELEARYGREQVRDFVAQSLDMAEKLPKFPP
jgi:hypothetical protein